MRNLQLRFKIVPMSDNCQSMIYLYTVKIFLICVLDVWTAQWKELILVEGVGCHLWEVVEGWGQSPPPLNTLTEMGSHLGTMTRCAASQHNKESRAKQ